MDCVIQIGSVKGVARFMQRAGRSGHSPFERSKIYFIPTHSLELVEVSALKEAVKDKQVESRDPMVLTFDVLVQFMVTLAVGEGFNSSELFLRVQQIHACIGYYAPRKMGAQGVNGVMFVKICFN